LSRADIEERSSLASEETPTSSARPLGQPRGIFFVIVITIITLGIYHLYWVYKVYEEMKQHTGEGLGGVVGLVIALVIGVVNYFVIPSEIGKMYRVDGSEAPMSGWTGLWIILPILGWFVWIVKVQGALNRYWESKGALA
jgi:tetrahydromethanopterin S-methyltransferase subunit G